MNSCAEDLVLRQCIAPRIGPPRQTGRRPFWSVMIPAYNRTRYLEETLRSVLSQDPGAEEMQIEVVDDASTEGDSEPLVRRIAGTRVDYVRHPHRVGGVANWNSCIERSIGEWVHILHNDDLVLPGFYARLRAAVGRRDDVGAAFCRNVVIDENGRPLWTSELEASTPGILDGFIEKLGISQRIHCPAIVVRRSVYENLGGFRTDLSYAADWEMWVRIAARYPIWYEPSTLAAFRTHSASWTAAAVRSVETVADERRCIAVIRALLPPDRAEAMSRKARELVSLRALDTACGALGKREFVTAFRQVREGLKCRVSPPVIKALLWLPVRIARGGIRRAYAAGKKQFGQGKADAVTRVE